LCVSNSGKSTLAVFELGLDGVGEFIQSQFVVDLRSRRTGARAVLEHFFQQQQ
jgi:hypothetical protein